METFETDKPEVSKGENYKKHEKAEDMEGRAKLKRNCQQPAAIRTQRRGFASTSLLSIREVAKRNEHERFTSLLHHITVPLLEESYYSLQRRASKGVDGVTWKEYRDNLKTKLINLHHRIQKGSYRCNKVQRVFIPKPDGSQRKLSIWTVEDKVVQQAVAMVLNEIYEVDFMGFSYGFRKGRSQHDALDALHYGIYKSKINWILDSDISKFFDSVDHKILISLISKRIGDKRILRLIQKWLKCRITEDGKVSSNNIGIPQGSVIGPLIANIYLHYAFDTWLQKWRENNNKGDIVVVRYGDDTVIGFQYETDALRLKEELTVHLKRFNLELHENKTRTIEFGRYTLENHKKKGEKPKTFDFLGFTHFCTTDKKGWFKIGRKTKRKSTKKILAEIKEGLRKRLHRPLHETGKWLKSVLTGHLNYFSVSGNLRNINSVFRLSTHMWLKSIRRRSQHDNMIWSKFENFVKKYIPILRLIHAHPIIRFSVKTQERSRMR